MAYTAYRTWVTGEIVTAALMNEQVRDNGLLTAPAKLTTAGDILYASGANTPARVGKGTNGNILHQVSCAPAWTATPSITDLTLSGALDVNGTIDYDGTCVDFLSSGDIDIVSSRNAAEAVYIAQSSGTSGTVKISADTGTSVTEGAESVNIVSVAGGVGIRSTANLAKAINLTVDSGTTSSIAIFNDTGSATGSICLKSDVGGITLNPGTFVTVGGNTANAAEIRMFEDEDHGCLYVALKAPNVTGSYTITLPTAVAGGNCYVLTSTNAGVTSWAAPAGGPCQASQAEVACESDVDKYVAPDMLKYSPGVTKAWVQDNTNSCTANASYNITSVSSGATGIQTVTTATDVTGASQGGLASSTGARHISGGGCGGAGSTTITLANNCHVATDHQYGWHVYGEFA